MDINKLSLEEKIGQRFMLGVNSFDIDKIIEYIKKYHIGGVILYRKNYKDYIDMVSVIKKIKLANKDNKIPLFISIDQEGGRVNRLPTDIVNLKSIYDVSKKDKNLIYEYGNITGKILSGLGINMNFAPVLDLDDNESKLLYKRCFFGDVDDVSECGIKYFDGIRKNNVISVFKHFPGHGVSKFDSHLITPYIYNYKDVLERHIIPFDKMLSKKVDAIMVNHLIIRKLTNGLPASISAKFIKGYIRERYKYDGLIITDELNMLSRNPFLKFNYMRKSILSGSDILLVKVNNKVNIIDKCLKFVEDNDEYLKMIDDSVDRIIKIKMKYNISDDIDNIFVDIDNVNMEINKINEIVN